MRFEKGLHLPGSLQSVATLKQFFLILKMVATFTLCFPISQHFLMLLRGYGSQARSSENNTTLVIDILQILFIRGCLELLSSDLSHTGLCQGGYKIGFFPKKCL